MVFMIIYVYYHDSSRCNKDRKTSLGTFTLPICFIFFFPSFCLSSSFLLRVISPPYCINYYIINYYIIYTYAFSSDILSKSLNAVTYITCTIFVALL